MKFKDMPYERIDFAKAKAELSEIMEKSKAAKPLYSVAGQYCLLGII